MVVAGQELFSGCWPEDNSSIFTKKNALLQNLVSLQLQMKKTKSWGFVFFLLQSFLESWGGPGSGVNADLGVMPQGCG